MHWILLALVVLTSGCSYLQDRGRDALDVIWVDYGWGFGLQADFQATDLVHSGLGGTIGTLISGKAGLRRGSYHNWAEPSVAFVLGRLVYEGPFPDPTYRPSIRKGYLFNAIYLVKEYQKSSNEVEITHTSWNPRRPWLNALDVDVGVTALLATRIGISPGEFLDFLGGWFGVDVGADDGGNRRGRRRAPESYVPVEETKP